MDTSFGDFIAFSAPDKNDTNQQNQQQQRNDNKFQGKKKVDADGDSLSETDDDAAEGSLRAPKIIIKSISSNRRAYVAAVPEDVGDNNNEDGAHQSGTDDDDSDSYSQSNDDCGDEAPENGNDDVHTNAGRNNGNNCDKSKKKVASSTLPPQSHQTKKSTAEYTEQFRDVTCDVFRGPDAPVHAMFHLTQSITVRGPCAVIGLCGQCLVQGYLLRQRSVIIPDFSSNNNNNNNNNINVTTSGSGGGGGGAGGQAHVAVQPIPPSCRKTVFNELVKGWSSNTSSGSVAIMQNLSQGVPINRNDPSIKEDLDTIAEIESIFGKINWSWTRQVLESWKQRFGRSSDLTVVLVIAEAHLHQHITIAPQQQQQPQQKKGSGNNNNKSSSSDFSRLPFFAPRMASVPHNKLLHSLLPELVTSPSRKFLQEQNVDGANQQSNTAPLPPSVLIAGSVNTGKSTTARYLCNLLVSLYGACLWLDLDLGQSEFAPPGGIGLFKVTEPLISSNQYRGVENILTHYLGTTTMRDPVATAKAIENICNKVSELHHRHHNGQEGASNNGGGSRRQRPTDDVGGENIGNNNNAQRQQQQQKRPLPIVINTHGWVLSTGRRATIEVLQRLCPSQVVHLFAPTCTDKEWLLPSGGVINDPARGLNSKVFLESKFSSNNNTITTTSTTTSSQVATGLLPAPVTRKWSFTIHRYIHEKLFEKDASDGRARAWTRYFWNSQAPMNENRSTAASLMLSSLSMAQALEKSEKAELVDFSANNNNNNNNNNTTSKNKVSIPTEIHSRPGKIISIPFDKVRLVFAEEEQMPWQFRGRLSKLIEPSSSKNNNAENEKNKHKFSITALTPAIKAELLDSISGALVALGTTKNLNNTSDTPSSSSSSLEISQLSCESNPPNIFGYGIILCAADSDSAANNFSSVKVVVPSDVAEVVEKEILTASSVSTTGQKNSGNDNVKRNISSSSSMTMINLVIGWQQYDTNWNQDMAKVALRGGV